MNTFLLLDLMSLIHPLVNSFEGAQGTEKRSTWEDKILPMWIRHILSCELWLPKGAGSVTPVFLVDQKNAAEKYWRHHYFARYKGGRKSHSDILKIAKGRAIELAQEAGVSIFMQPGFEADDFAGEFVRALGRDDRVLMMSVDSDWGQLISDRAIWLDTFCTKPRKHPDQISRVLDVRTIIKRHNSYKKNQRYLISNPRDVVEAKWILGDESDKIPAGRAVPRGIIDLINPLEYPVPIVLPGVNRDIQVPSRIMELTLLPPLVFGLPRFADYEIDLNTMTTLHVPSNAQTN